MLILNLLYLVLAVSSQQHSTSTSWYSDAQCSVGSTKIEAKNDQCSQLFTGAGATAGSYQFNCATDSSVGSAIFCTDQSCLQGCTTPRSFTSGECNTNDGTAFGASSYAVTCLPAENSTSGVSALLPSIAVLVLSTAGAFFVSTSF
jgi:hypothetical protein